MCCCPQGCKESDMIWRLNNDNKHRHNVHLQNALPEDVLGMQPNPVDLSQLCGHTGGGPPAPGAAQDGGPSSSLPAPAVAMFSRSELQPRKEDVTWMSIFAPSRFS